MKSSEFIEYLPKVDYFYQECLALLNELSIESLLNRIVTVSTTITNASYCVCGTVDDADQFTKIILGGLTRTEMDLIHSDEAETGLSIRNIQGKKSYTVSRSKEFSDVYNIFPAKRPTVNSLLFVPILYKNKKIASIILMNKIGANAFDEFDLKTIDILAEYAGISINNIAIYDQIATREQMLSKRNEDLALLNELAKISASSMDDLQTIVNETMHQVMGYLDLDVGEVFLKDETTPNSYKMMFKEGHSFFTSILGFATVQENEGPVGKTAYTRKPYELSGEELQIINQKKATAVQMNYFIVLPLITSGGVLGLCCLGTKLVDVLEKPNVQFLSSVASWMAMLIQDFQLNRERKQIAIFEERDRISMDLHDGVIQSIYGVGLALEHALMISKTDPEKTEAQIQLSINALNATIRDIRSYIMDLKPAHLTNENLIQSLRKLSNDFYANSLVKTRFVPTIEDIDNISEDYANTFYMICKEALSNVSKHAKASQVEISFVEKPTRYVLTVQDNGSGFDTSQKRQSTNHGITNMFARAKNLGGNLTLSSKPGKGTKVEVWFPKSKKKR